MSRQTACLHVSQVTLHQTSYLGSQHPLPVDIMRMQTLIAFHSMPLDIASHSVPLW